MVEVFKTNVTDQKQAKFLLDQIHRIFPDYAANFDLDDCDRILRIETKDQSLQPANLIEFLRSNNVEVEILDDFVQIFEY